LPEYYEIKIRGHLDPRWSDWFAGLKLTHLEAYETLLSSPLPTRPHSTACSSTSAISI
jgi:hypothetical protein